MVFPELAHFPNRRERLRALNAAFAAVPGLLALVLVALVASAVMTYTLDALVFQPILRLSPLTEWVTIAATIFLSTLLTSFALVGTHVQRQLRLQLQSRGLALCTRCGYDLRGLASSRCPECGATDHRSADHHYPTAIRVLLWAGLILPVIQVVIIAPVRLLAGQFEWFYAPGLLCWAMLGLHCWSRIRKSFFR